MPLTVALTMREEEMEKASQQREMNEADTKEECSSEGW